MSRFNGSDLPTKKKVLQFVGLNPTVKLSTWKREEAWIQRWNWADEVEKALESNGEIKEMK